MILALLTVNGFEYLVLSTGQDARQVYHPEGAALYSLSRNLLTLFLAALIVRKRALGLAIAEWPVFLLVGYAALSTLWSVAPEVSLSALYSVASATVVGLWICDCAGDKRRVFHRLELLCRFLVLGNLLTIVMMPALASMVGIHEGAIRGFFHHKNELGLHMCLATIVFLCAFLGRRSWTNLCFLAGGSVLVFMSASSSAIALSFGASLLTVLFWSTRFIARTPLTRLLIVLYLHLCVAMLVYAAALSLDYLTGLFDRDVTLSGRVPLWMISWDVITRGPWFGYGFQAFWGVVTRSSNIVPWAATAGHNGYLDALLEGGIVGGTLLALVNLALWIRGLRSIVANRVDGTSVFTLTFVSLLFAYNLVESVFLSDRSLVLSFVMAAMALGPRPGKPQPIEGRALASPRTGSTRGNSLAAEASRASNR